MFVSTKVHLDKTACRRFPGVAGGSRESLCSAPCPEYTDLSVIVKCGNGVLLAMFIAWAHFHDWPFNFYDRCTA